MTATIAVMENGPKQLSQRFNPPPLPGRLIADTRGAVLVESAIGISLLLTVLVGIVTYGSWFMAAHSLQQVANEAARSTLGAINAEEREEMVDRSVESSIAQTGVIDEELMTVQTEVDGAFYTVSLTYDIARYPLFSSSLLPLPADSIVRSATIELSTL